MRGLFVLVGWAAVACAAQQPAGQLWPELSAKRESLKSFHQEFDAVTTFRRGAAIQSSKRQVAIDVAGKRWRERNASGSGAHIRLFDGLDMLTMEDGGAEYVKTKRKAKDEEPRPSVYDLPRADWSKATALERQDCKIPGKPRDCVLLRAPLKQWTTGAVGNSRRMIAGAVFVQVDTETGLLVFRRTIQEFEGASGKYQSDAVYTLRRFSVGVDPDPGLFALAANMREVKELKRWDASRIKKDLVGKPAPELSVTDLAGKPLSLAAYKGRTVLLDFWTTWCGPCRADGPALDKLHQKYGERDIAIIGVSVSEDRAVVEKFLAQHPHAYPIVLTTENEMPSAYQIGVFPTYIVIDRDGNVANAAEGDKGFNDLRKMLKKAGLETE
jgi:thiol-disulfide isomerase/thioredoxin